MYHCYIIYSGNRSYVGATTNPTRRIRQHNGILKGGAKSTRARQNWKYAVIISGLPDKRNMLQCEWAIKHTKHRGVKGRIKGLFELLQKDKWTNNSTILIKDIDLKIEVFY